MKPNQDSRETTQPQPVQFGTQWWQRGNRSKTRQNRTLLEALIAVTVFSLLIATGLFVFLNVQPYIKVVEILAGQSLDWSIVNFVMGLPAIGWLLSLISGITATLIGIALWAIIQFFELLPTLLTRDIETLRSIINRLEKAEQIPVSENDHPFLARLKDQFNDLPFEWIELAARVAMVVYPIDFGLCLMTYPPIAGGFNSIGLFLIAPSLADIDWANLLCAIVTLFAIEVIWRAWHWLRNISEHFRARSKSQQPTS